jgi:hypothetical protein
LTDPKVHGARGTAGSEQDDAAPRDGVATGLLEGAHKAQGVGIVAHHGPVVAKLQRVDRSNRARGIRDRIA